MGDLYLCLGADGGARSESLLRAAALMAHRLGAASVVCSSMFGDRHRQMHSGATVNMVVCVKRVQLTDEKISQVIEDVELQLGRVRDPDRQVPVLIDIDWIGTASDVEMVWNERYDRGCPYIWLGLHQLEDSEVRVELERISLERDFSAEDMAKGFYPLMTAEFATKLVAGALGGQPVWLEYEAA